MVAGLAAVAVLAAPAAQEIDSEALVRHVVRLSADEMEGRMAQKAGYERAAEYVAAEFRRAGYEPVVQRLSIGVGVEWAAGNIVAVRPGRAAAGAILVTAHLDGLGTAEDPNIGRMPAAPGTDPLDRVWNGADDNATGVAALLEIARVVAREEPARTVVFVALSGQEFARAGARMYMAQPPVAPGEHGAAVSLHMLGRNPGRPARVSGLATSEDWLDVVEAASRRAGVAVAAEGLLSAAADAYGFADGSIPGIEVSGGLHDDYRRPSDEASRIDAGALLDRTRLGLEIVRELAARRSPPRWREGGVVPAPHPAGRTLGIEGRALTEPELRELSIPGRGAMYITGVQLGSVAEAAGFQSGDVLVEWEGAAFSGDRPVRELRERIEAVEPGRAVEAVVVRDGRREVLRVVWRE